MMNVRKQMRRMLGAAVLTSGILVLTAEASVFRLWGSGRSSAFNNGKYPWEKAYETTMTVNGRKNTVCLYSVRYSEPVIDQLRSRFEDQGAKVMISKTEDGATGVAAWVDKEARFLVLSPKSKPQQMVFVFYPEPGSTPRDIPFPVPKYARGTVSCTVSDDDTGTFFATLETRASATESHTFYAQALQAEGWQMVAPALVKNGTISGMAVYQKKKKICYVQATDRVGGVNMITLLVKGGTL